MEASAIKGLEDIFIEVGGKLCDLIGWRRAMGQVYMLLYIADSPLSIEDMAERINMSKSTVWAIVKKLQRLCAVNKAWGKEKEGYTAERDLNVILKNGVLPELNSKLLFASSYLERANELLADFCRDASEENLAELTKYRSFIDDFTQYKNKLDFFLKQVLLLNSKNKFESGKRKAVQSLE
jgi:DNA-binding transcriptional regulator GbsR (MarR family)